MIQYKQISVLLVGVREFECSSFKEFLTWKEKEEEKNNVFYAQTTGRKALDDCTNIGEIGMSYNVIIRTYTITC